jgi:hypothetical protein
MEFLDNKMGSDLRIEVWCGVVEHVELPVWKIDVGGS